ncbi:hypothetical protein AEAC466_13550 [Asticcacaulis sp. AC466]|uniref:hypothetical protein n=1 Tax=Asticcacaulis sp. AC466 TaxID=1282362 RepID=UPI0003C3C421|nr:hypothetical protein [Asticcacaulis sp. AC466]ESQ83271.1 hypothetical protein AEAC466_13550 [Asticcacaulis sp. AC466]
MKTFDWKLKYLLQLVLAVTALIALGLAYKLYTDGETSLYAPEFGREMMSIFAGGAITVAVVYVYSLIAQFFKQN